MPITVTVPSGLMTDAAAADIVPRLSRALLARHGLTGNQFMAPIVIGSLNLLPKAHVYAGGRENDAIFIELKVPSVTFTSQEQRQGFLDDAHAILNELSNGRYPKERTFLNITYALDGSWGVGDKAYTNEQLGAAIAQAAAA